jgi:hypothetical protein
MSIDACGIEIFGKISHITGQKATNMTSFISYDFICGRSQLGVNEDRRKNYIESEID